MESNSLKLSSIQMVHSIELKFGIYIIGHRPIYCGDFDEFRINSSFTEVQMNRLFCTKINLYYFCTIIAFFFLCCTLCHR